MPLPMARALVIVALVGLLLAPSTPWSASPPALARSLAQLSLQEMGLQRQDVPPDFVPVPNYYLRYGGWDVVGIDRDWNEYSRGHEYVASFLVEDLSPEDAWRNFPDALVPEGGYDERWLDPPAVGEEAALFQLTEQTPAGPQRGYEVKWRRGRYLGRITVLGISDDPGYAIELAQRVDSRMLDGNPGQMDQPPDEGEVALVGRQAQDLRELAPRGRVRFSIATPGTLEMPSEQQGLAEQLLPSQEIGLLRLLGQPLDPAGLPNLAVGVGGAYVPSTNRVALLLYGWPLEARDRLVVAHEFVHVVQQQHFQIETLVARAAESVPLSSDVALAALALPEGDAEFASHLYADAYLGPAAWAEYLGEQDHAFAAARLPPLWEGRLRFPYVEGERFVAGFHADGGWAEVNSLYSRPPVSTEQVLHPEKYVANELPLPVEPPAVSGVASRSWRTLRVDTLGELGLRALLQPFLDGERASSAAAGWGGDTYVLVGPDDEHPFALALDSVWENEAEAREFFGALVDSQDRRFAGGARRWIEGPARISWTSGDFQVSAERKGARVRYGVAPDRAALLALAPPLR